MNDEGKIDSAVAHTSMEAQESLTELLKLGQNEDDLRELVEHTIQEWNDGQ